MATQLQIRRGTTAQMNAFTGAEGELAVNTTTDTLHVHDGATAGGKALARADGSNIATYAGSFTTIAASGAITGNVTGNLTGSILTAAQTNITSVGTLSTLAVTGEITANGGIALGDSDKATFGASDDLQIYHDGSNSRIVDAGTGILTIQASSQLGIYNADATQVSAEFVNDGKVGLRFSGSEKLATTATGIDVTGNVNIGSGASISPDADADNLVIQENGAAGITIGSSASSVGSIRFADSGSPRAGMIYYNHVGNEMRFYTLATEAYRITAARDMYFGQTSGSAADVGHIMQANGVMFHTADATTGMYLRRLNSDGGILEFRKDSTSVGSIGTLSGTMYIGNGDCNLLFTGASDQMLPVGTNGATKDGQLDLGSAGNRFKDLYLSGQVNTKTIAAQRGNAGTLIQASSSSGNGSGIINFMSSLTSSSNNTNCVHYQGTTQGINSYKLLGNGSSTWSSDINLKRDVETARDGYLEDVKALRVVKYKWKNDPDSSLELGLIAQEVEAIFPSLVTEDKNAIGDEVLYTADDQIPEGKDVGDVKLEGTTYKGVKYSVLPIIMLKAIQEQQATIEALTQRIGTLENN